jgi:hypothetical protein
MTGLIIGHHSVSCQQFVETQITGETVAPSRQYVYRSEDMYYDEPILSLDKKDGDRLIVLANRQQPLKLVKSKTNQNGVMDCTIK